MQRLRSQRQSADGVLVLSTIKPLPLEEGNVGAAGFRQPRSWFAQSASCPWSHHSPQQRVALKDSLRGKSVEWCRQLLCCQNRAEWSWPGNGRGGDQKAHLAAHRTHILTDVGCPPQSLAALGGQGLSSTPAGRHRLAGQRAWPMNPAKKVGNNDPGGKQG